MSDSQGSLSGAWLKAFFVILLCYFVLGKGFAYLFLGEFLLVVGGVIFLVSRRLTVIFSDSVLFLWALFALWGFCRTVPFLSRYRFDAVRDSVVWGYGLAALFIVTFVNRSSQISRALNAYRKFLRWYLPVVPILLIASLTVGNSLPKIPWSQGVSILLVKPGDEAVNIAAAGLFLLIFQDRQIGSEKQGVSIYRAVGFFGWVVTALVVMIDSRGGTVGIILSILLVFALRAREVAWKVAAIAIVGALLAVGIFSVAPSNLHFAHKTFNSEKLLATVGSIGGEGGEGTGHEGTAKWRLLWWRNIIRETFFGPYFWTGRGFGVNLAIADGPPGFALSKEEVALRSPHNGSMTVLARMGVPGFVIWLVLNFVFALRLLRAQRRASRLGLQFWSGLYLWILACWLATFANMSTDVYLEGPQGGIWFWSIIGFGVAALRIQPFEARQLLSRPQVQANDVPHLAVAR